MNDNSTTEAKEVNFVTKRGYPRKLIYMVIFQSNERKEAVSYKRIDSKSVPLMKSIIDTLKKYEPIEGKLHIDKLALLTGHTHVSISHVCSMMAGCERIIYRDPSTLRWKTLFNKPPILLQQAFKTLNPTKYGQKSPLYVMIARKKEFTRSAESSEYSTLFSKISQQDSIK